MRVTSNSARFGQYATAAFMTDLNTDPCEAVSERLKVCMAPPAWNGWAMTVTAEQAGRRSGKGGTKRVGTYNINTN